MREIPILFSAPMVRAIRDGKKSVTRRIVHSRDERLREGNDWAECLCAEIDGSDRPCVVCAERFGLRWTVGDRLWVRETCSLLAFTGETDPKWEDGVYHDGSQRECIIGRDGDLTDSDPPRVWFHADGDLPKVDEPWHWARRNSIHMPRWAARLILEVTDVRTERLQAISEAEAEREGVRPFFEEFSSIGRDQRLTTGELCAEAEHRASFAVLWDTLNADRGSWAANPWVCAISFRAIAKQVKL